MTKAVILLSGGLDSTTCLAYAKTRYTDCYALSFDYGQKHRVELQAAQQIAALYQVKKHLIIALALDQIGGSALTDATMAVPEYSAEAVIPVTYVPARNTVMLSIALGWAEVLDADAIVIGVSAVDYSHYPDCRAEYIEAFQQLMQLATKKGVEGGRITLDTPLLHLSKAQTCQLGASLGVDYAMTVSCYQAVINPEGYAHACGRCASCVLRKKGFADAGMADPTRYVA